MASDPKYYKYIVIGCGGIGSAALYWLAKRHPNKGVLGLEQFSLGHHNGSSQDHSRIIRLTYHDEKYSRLMPEAYKAWSEVEEESGLELVYRCGGLDMAKRGTPGEDRLRTSLRVMDNLNIPYTYYKNGGELSAVFPQFRGPGASELVGVLQKDGGLVDAAMANAAHIQLARARGATVMENCGVNRIINNHDDTLTVHSTKGVFTCRNVTVAAGAWTNHVIGSLGVHLPLVVTQEQVTYFATSNLQDFQKDKFPVFRFHCDNNFYGFPIHGTACTKIGRDAAGTVTTPESRTFVADPERERQSVEFLQEYIPDFLGPISQTKTCLYTMPYDRDFVSVQFLGPISQTKTCLYTMPYDRDFVLDSLAQYGHPRVQVFAGAGHAFKFASLLGKILSELATDGATQYPIEGFSVSRPAVSDPQCSKDPSVVLKTPGKPQAKL